MPAQIDPNIALGVKPSTFDPAQSLGQMYALKNAGVRNQIEAQQQQLQQYQLQQAGQQQQDAQAGRAAITANTQTDPTTGIPTLNRAGYLGQLATTAPGQYLGAAQSFTAQDIANAKATADYKKTQLENAKAHTDYVGSLLQGVTDQASYTSALNAAQSAGIVKPGEMPAVYDPQLVQRQLAQTMTQKDVIAQQQKQLELQQTALRDKNTQTFQTGEVAARQQNANTDTAKLAEERRHNGVTEAQGMVTPTPGGQNSPMVQAIIDGRAPAPNSRSKQGMALMQQVTAADPTYDASRYQTYQKMQADMTSGKLGDSINSLNTIQEHIGKALNNMPSNTSMPALNYLKNAGSEAMGGNPTGKFDVDATGIAGEWGKLVAGGVASEGEQRHVQELLSPNASPQKMRENLAEVKSMTDGKLAGIQKQIYSAIHPNGTGNPANSLPGGIAPAAPAAVPVSSGFSWGNHPVAQ